MIEVSSLTKKYGSTVAVNDVSFKLESGHVYGLIGTNGAGKSTLLNMLTGCLSPTSGEISIFGDDIYEHAMAAKRRVGYLPEIPPLYPEMTVFEYLLFVARAKKYKGDRYHEIARVSELCGVTGVQGKLIRTLSKGYRQRVGIASALIGDPEVVILDEPTVGLDPIQLLEFRNLIASLREGHIVLISSHIMEEITSVCDCIIILAQGSIAAKGTLDELEGSRRGRTVTVLSGGNSEQIKEVIEKVDGVDYVASYPRGDYVKSVIETKEGYDVKDAVRYAVSSAGAEIREITDSRVSLEDIFIRLTSEAAMKAALGSRDGGEERREPDTDVHPDPAPRARRREKQSYDPLGSPYLDGRDDAEDDVSEGGERQ